MCACVASLPDAAERSTGEHGAPTSREFRGPVHCTGDGFRYDRPIMSEGNLFERAGGEHGVEKLVTAFYARVLGDPKLAPFFKDAETDKLQRMQVELFSAALGGPAIYSGRGIREVHAGLGIEHEHIRRYVEHLLDTLKSMDLDENDVNAIYSEIATYADELTGGMTSDG